jgi:hypothetical protein
MKDDNKYTSAEIKQRMEAALRGARIAGPQHKIVTPKAKKGQRKRKATAPKSS